MTKLELKHPNGFVLGVAFKRPDGWYFYPKVSGRSPSRRGHPTADACLPAWAKKAFRQGASFLPPAPYEVRYYLAGKDHVRQFATRELAEQYAAFCKDAFVPAAVFDPS